VENLRAFDPLVSFLILGQLSITSASSSLSPFSVETQGHRHFRLKILMKSRLLRLLLVVVEFLAAFRLDLAPFSHAS
jgi:hypothetical protein